jgi:dTDP-4-amino-4,6-dideoxygalactose transaminase
MPIPFNKATITKSDQRYLQQAIDNGHTAGNGKFTKLSEELISNKVGTQKTLLTTSCTHSLEMAALLLNLNLGDEVIVPSFTFVSTASAFALFGATPVFVDSDDETLNIDPRLIEQAITPKTRAICLVHYGGVACDMVRILEIAREHDLVIIEDNAHGLFAKYQGKYLGTFGALATQSFHETKNLTCGEGGALLINDHSLIERAEILREKGTDRSKFLRGQVDKYTWVDIGSSWIMSDMLAAVLYGQLERCDEILSQRMTIWNGYASEFTEWAAKNGVRIPHVPSGCEHTGHVFHLRFNEGQVRDRFIAHLREREISAVFHYQPLHLSHVGRKYGGFSGQCPVSEKAGDCLVRLPLYDSLSEAEQNRVIEVTKSFHA